MTLIYFVFILAPPDVYNEINTMIHDMYSFGEMKLDRSNEDELVPTWVKLPRACKRAINYKHSRSYMKESNL